MANKRPEVKAEDFNLSPEDSVRFAQAYRLRMLTDPEFTAPKGAVTLLRDFSETATTTRKLDLETKTEDNKVEFYRQLLDQVMVRAKEKKTDQVDTGEVPTVPDEIFDQFKIEEFELEVGVGSTPYETIFKEEKN